MKDLDWLARNVHDPKPDRRYAKDGNSVLSWPLSIAVVYHKDYPGSEVAEERARLQGDWRNTLERRPERKPSEKTAKALKEAGGMSKQWSGTKDGLPPVNTECEINISLINGKPNWVSGTIVGHVFDEKEELAVIQMANDFTFRSASYFRPLRTEEDKAVEEMVEIIAEEFNKSNDGRAANEDIAKALFRAGYRKLDKPDASD